MIARASLRQSDWRFLLPQPAGGAFRHLLLLGAPPGLPQRILDEGLAQRVSSEIVPGRSVDAVILLHRARVRPMDVVRCLAPGGALYCEIDRRSRQNLTLTPARLQHALRQAGLVPTGLYYVAPDFTSGNRYLPLDAPGALRWYQQTLYLAGTPRDRLLGLVMRFLTERAGDRFPAWLPCYAVTAVTGDAFPAAPSVLNHPDLPAPLRVEGLRPVLLTSGQDEGSRVVMLPFAPGGAEPLAVLKVATRADFNANTWREQEALTEVHAHLDDVLRPTVPQPLGTFQYGALAVSVESSAQGPSLWVSSGQWPSSTQRQIDDLQLAANWLIQFHQRTQGPRQPWDRVEIDRWVERPIAAYVQRFAVTPEEERLFCALRACAAALVGASLPLVRLHYDFGPWNLFRAGEMLTVIDWEFGRDWAHDRVGPALCDLLYLATYWNHIARHLHDERAQLAGLYNLFIAPDRRDARTLAVHAVLSGYMAALQMDRRFLPLLLVYTWLEQSLYQFARKEALGELHVDARSGNRSVRYIGVLATHVEQLFSDDEAGIPGGAAAQVKGASPLRGASRGS